MSKSKSSSKSAKPEKDILTKVKDAAIVKPAQTIKAKSKDLAKAIAGEEEKNDKKSKKSKKAVKEPTPEPSDSEESASSESSDSEEEKETKKPVANGKSNGVKKPAPKEDSSDDSESEESEASASDSESESESEEEEEAPKVNGNTKKAQAAPAAKKVEESSDESDEDSEADSDDDSDDDSSEDEKPSKATSKKADTKTVAPAAAASESGSESDADANDSDSSEESDEEEKPKAKQNKRKAEEDAEPAAKKSKTEEVDTSRGSNLFVGNLSWNVDEAWLREVFEEFGELTGVRIMTERDSGRSKGFGYVEFANAADAAKAHAAKAGAELDGRNINVDFANARPDNSQKQDNRRKSYGDSVSEPSDTLFLGNLSFDVGQEMITEAFAPHGTILSVRLPTDRDTGAPKGFGYVTFSTSEEAGVALEAMQGAYIESRPVRLDYSTPRPPNTDSPGRGRGGFGGGFGGRGGGRGGPRGGARGGRGGRGGSFGGRGDRGGRGGRGGSTNRGGFGDFSGRKTSFD